MAGVRSLDLRVATIGRNTVIAHRFPNVPLQVVLNDIVDFVTNNPSEIVIVQVKRDYDNDVNWVEVAATFGKEDISSWSFTSFLTRS
jgi:hypothetical protein